MSNLSEMAKSNGLSIKGLAKETGIAYSTLILLSNISFDQWDINYIEAELYY